MRRLSVSTAVAVGLVAALIVAAGLASLLAVSPVERLVTVTVPPRTVTVTAEGRTVTSTVTKTVQVTPEELLNPLIDAARREGGLVIYSTLNTQQLEPQIALFRRLYPGIEVQFVRAPSSALIDRILSEVRAAKFPFDVIDNTLAGHVVLHKEGVEYQRYEPISLQSPLVLPEYRAIPGLEGTVFYEHFAPITFAYNTKLVKPAEIKSYTDLSNPKWKGRIGIPGPLTHLTTLDWFLTMREVMGAQWADWVKGVVANEPKLYLSLTPVAKGIALGEVAWGLTLFKDARTQKLQGQPIENLPLNPSYAIVVGIGISKKAPHPNAAKLWVEFALSKDGQDYFLGLGDTGIRTDLSLPPDVLESLKGIKVLPTSPFTPDQEKAGAEELKSLGFK